MKNVTARASTLPHVEWGGIDVSLRLRRSTKLLLARMNVPFGLKAEMLTTSQ
jgi:hypothetical protein